MAQKFIRDWFSNPNWWFDQNDETDSYITNRYQHLLDVTIFNDPLQEIIVYDQLPRHVFRMQDASHVITYFLEKALCAIDKMTNSYIENLTCTEWCFAMLPIRHKKDAVRIHRVIQKAWDRLEHAKDKNDVFQLRRFIKASYERCPTNDQKPFIKKLDDFKYFNSKEFKDILGHCPDRNIPSDIDKNNEMYKHVKTVMEKLNITKQQQIIMSLSGGVDSMVAMHILHQLGYNLVAVNINYNNRIVADDEERFVTTWALSIPILIYVRKIHEIRREPCMNNDLRNVYESYTRNVRYSTYKSVCNNPNPYVILGHNKDDCLENIFQNISHNSKYDDLCGMKHLSPQDDINFVRPLLNIPKADIIQFAKDHNIPYLPNSTPAWSQRGQIRNKIVPCLNSWNSDLIPGLYDLASVVSDMHKISVIYITETANKFKDDPLKMTKTASLDHSLIQTNSDSEFFWKTLVQLLFPANHVSKKSMKSFVERLVLHLKDNDKNNKPVHFNLNKDLQICLQWKKHNTTICFRYN